MIRFQLKRGLAWLGPFFLFIAPFGADESVTRLETISVSSTATEFLQTDLIHPVKEMPPRYSNGSGTLDQSLSRDYPVQVLTGGSPGTITQFRGFGVRSEDTNVQTLGVSLNPAQGGGFDFSTMPLYLWSSYRYQVGPASASFDPRSFSGVVSLVPWTARALDSKARGVWSLEPSVLVSSLDLRQYAVGAVNSSSTVAAVAGGSFGSNQGASGSLSAKLDLGAQDSVRFHLIATDLIAKVPGSTTFPTPLTTSRSQRVLPIMNWDHITDSVVSKLTVYTDLSNLNQNSPEGGYTTFDQTRAYGANYAVGFSGWKIGLLGRKLVYKTSVPTPDEDMGQAQILKSITVGDRLVLEPLVRGTTITGYSFLPEAAFGARYEFSQALRVFSRAGVNRRFPTLVDRFYTLPGSSQGNPNLDPETNYSVTVGIDSDVAGKLNNLLQLTYQESEGVQQYLPISDGSSVYMVQNSGNGQMLSLFHIVKVELTKWFEMTKTFSINLSRLERTHGKYNYLPWGKNVYHFRIHDPSDANKWGVSFIHQWVSESTIPSATLPSYLVGDVVFDYALLGMRAGFKVENIADTRYQTKLNEPVPGRTYIFSLQASL